MAEPTKSVWRFSRPIQYVLGGAVVYFFVLPLIPGLRNAVRDLKSINPYMLIVGIGLQGFSLLAYSMLTRAALGDEGHKISPLRLFRIQLSTKSVGNILPGGSAASTALGYRMLTLSGVAGPDAGFALATAGLGSAVMLNVILWFGLIVSAGRGVNAAYGTAAIIGIILMLVAAALIFGLIDGQGRAERFIRLCARKLRMDEDHAAEVLEHLGNRLQGLASEPKLLTRVLGWALVNWLLDMLALYVFIRAFGGNVAPDALIVSFGLANILSVVPITPGGLGIVEGIYIPTLVGFGLTRNVATVGVLSYRIAQYWLPILVGGFTYLSLRVGPFAIERNEKLRSLRKVTKIASEHPTTKYEFLEQYAPRDRTGQYPLPEIKNRFLLGDDDEE